MSTPVSLTPPQPPRRSVSTNNTNHTTSQQQRRGGSSSSSTSHNNSTSNLSNMNRNVSSSGLPMIPNYNSTNTTTVSNDSLMDHMQRMIDLQYAQQQLLQQQQHPQPNSLFQPLPPPPPPPPPVLLPPQIPDENDGVAAVATTTMIIPNSSHHSAAVEAVSPASSTWLVRNTGIHHDTTITAIRPDPTTTTTSTGNSTTTTTTTATNFPSTVTAPIFHQDLFLDHVMNNNMNDSYTSFQGSFDSMKDGLEPQPPLLPSQSSMLLPSISSSSSQIILHHNSSTITASAATETDRIVTLEDRIDDQGALLWRTSSERLLASFRHQDSQTYSPDTPSYSAGGDSASKRIIAARDSDTDVMVAVVNEVEGSGGVGGSSNEDDDISIIRAAPTTTTTTSANDTTDHTIPYRYDPTDHDVDHLISATTQLLPTLNRSNVSRCFNNLYPTTAVSSYGSLLPITTTDVSTTTSLDPSSNTVVVSHSNLDALFVPPPPPPPPFAHHPNYSNTLHPDQPPQQQQMHQEQQQQMEDAILRGFAGPSSSKRHSSSRNNTSGIQHFGSSLYQFCFYCCWYPVQQCCIYFYYAESLHRSFCYGAIDGMLTGAGIVSTFCGMGLLSTTTNNSPPVRALVVAFTATTCFADAICMAIGHVWTTHIMYDTRSHERHTARQQLFHNKSDAKGMLVDLLLSRGMLKIDAMSIADTLEGYPDLFINVVTGDALSAGGGLPPTSQHHDTGSPATSDHRHQGIDIASEEHEHLLYHDNDTDGAISPGPVSQHHPQQSHRYTSYPSYGRLTEYEMDPDTYTAQTMTNESRKESCCMMLGFVLFAVVPSIIYTLVPTILFGPKNDAAGIHFSSIFVQHYDATTTTSSSSNTHDDTSLSSTDESSFTTPASAGTATVAMMMNPNTIIIVCTASIMWCLGVWKSRFVMSSNKRNWFVFGVETVMVLIICIVCAYGVGTVLNHTFLPDEYVLQVVQQQKQHHVVTRHHDVVNSRRYQPTNVAAAVVDVTSTTTTVTSSHQDNYIADSTNHDSVPSKATVASTNDDSDNISHPHYWYSF